MHRQNLLQRLDGYTPATRRERESARRTIEFVRTHADCFERTLTIGHITASAWLVDSTGKRALLTHHRKLGKWLQLGGHADGDADVLAVALREAKEESGIDHIEPVSEEIFDVDVHLIPERGNEPAHYHYDIRFLLRVPGSDVVHVSGESVNLAWVSPQELCELDINESVRQMCTKWQAGGNQC